MTQTNLVFRSWAKKTSPYVPLPIFYTTYKSSIVIFLTGAVGLISVSSSTRQLISEIRSGFFLNTTASVGSIEVLGVSSSVRLYLTILSGDYSSSFREFTLEFFLFTKFFIASTFVALSVFCGGLITLTLRTDVELVPIEFLLSEYEFGRLKKFYGFYGRLSFRCLK